MLRTLLESNAARPRRRGSTVASVAVHMLIIGGAIAATASAKPGTGETRETPGDTVIHLWPHPPTPRSATTTSVASGPVATPTLPRMPAWTLNLDPTGIARPEVDVDIGGLFGADSIPVEGVVGPGGGRGANPVAAAGREPATIATVERPAAMIAPPRPRYPEQLRAAGVTGHVVVRLVVDTAGRVEPGSIVIRESSHDLFTQAVRAVLHGLRFRPAEAGERKVRMLVDLPFHFRLNE